MLADGAYKIPSPGEKILDGISVQTCLTYPMRMDVVRDFSISIYFRQNIRFSNLAS